MSIEESLNKLTSEQDGVIRYIKSKRYISAIESHTLNETINLISILKERALKFEADLERELQRGFEQGIEEGKREFLSRFSNLLEGMSRQAARQAEIDREGIEKLFQHFLSRLATVLPERSIPFIEDYIKRFTDEYCQGYRINILVSEDVFKLLKEANLNTPNNIQILPNSDLKPEQIFFEYNGMLTEVSIDRFFEELSR